MLAELLEHLLHALEQIELHFILDIISVHIRVLEHLSTSNNLINCLLEEVKLPHGIVLHIVQHQNFVLDHWQQLLGMLLGLVVVVESFEVEHVLLQLVLRVIYLFLF